jgi:hypothetical protein
LVWLVSGCGGQASSGGQGVQDGSTLDSGEGSTQSVQDAAGEQSPDTGSVVPPHDAPSGEGATESGPADAGSEADAPAEAGPVSFALNFNGTSSYVQLPAASGGANETAFSSEIWFKTTTPTGMLFEVYAATGATGADRSTYLKNGTVCFYVYAPAASEICSTTLFNDGAWHNVAGTLGPNGQFLYVDGTVQAMAASVTSSAFNWDTAFRVGYGFIGSGGTLTFYQGEIDDVRVWSVERAAAQLAAGRGHDIDPATAGLQGYWKLNGTGATAVAKDSTAAMNDGTLAGFSYTPSPWVTPGAF